MVANFALVATAIFNGVAQGAQPLVSALLRSEATTPGRGKLLLLGSGTVLVLAAVLYGMRCSALTDTFVSWFNSENSVQMAQYAHTGHADVLCGLLLCRASTSWRRAI